MVRTSEINEELVGKELEVQGWLHRVRDHGGVLFWDIRDFDGIVQCVFDKNPNSSLKEESVVKVLGILRRRPKGTENPKLHTGDYEIGIKEVTVLNPADVLPFKVNVADKDFTASLEQRLTYRYLDLRRDKNKHMLKFRSDLLFYVREWLHKNEFTEVQTPILTASSPEGARDYLVPARLHPGKFYALPQAPQIFKQLLMASGVEKYFQIAPCFRDEAGRSDRSPGEFYQIDMELAFANQDMVMQTTTRLLRDIFREFGKYDISERFPIIPYKDAINKYGTDKPDMRADEHILISDATEIAKDSSATFLHDAIKKDGSVLVIPLFIDTHLAWSNKDWKELDSYARELGMPGLGYIKTDKNYENFSGPMAKFFSTEQMKEITSLFVAPPHLEDYALGCVFIAGENAQARRWAADLRVETAKRLHMFKQDSYEFAWITDYPMYELNEKGEIEFSHNPFSMPKDAEKLGLEVFNQDPLGIVAQQYDIVCNGIELSSGAVRNHKPELLVKAFEIAGYSEDDVKSKFPALWNAFRYGCPPHAGIAPGFDRLLMILLEKENIRDVIAFPMDNQARDLMVGAPNEPTLEQLQELNIRIKRS